MRARVNNLKNKIFESHLSDFQYKLNEVISMAESPIEELMLLQLFNYFQNYAKIDNDTNFTKIEFIEEEIGIGENRASTLEKVMLNEKITRYGYRENRGLFYKYIGFKCTINSSEPITKDTANGLIFRDIEIRPQFYQLYDDKYHRIDIAFILKRRDWFNDNKIIEERKIVIECDGYDYHSSPNQKREDDIRTRALKRAGWKDVLRYSGSEIYSLNDNLEKINYNFEEIMEIIML
jgi:hypothetical protein